MKEICCKSFFKTQPTVIVLVILNLSCNSHRSKSSDEAKSDSFNYRAKFFIETKQYDSAWYAINKSLFWDSNNWGAYNNRAILKYRTGSPESDVVPDFEKALHLKPDYEISLYSLANYYEDIKAYEKAVKASNEYFLVALNHDFDSTEPIRRLQQRCEKRITESGKIIDGVSVSQAITFYDSVNSVIDEAVPVEQKFIDKLAHAMQYIRTKKGTDAIDIPLLKKSLDSASKSSKNKIAKLLAMKEIDSTIGLKQTVLEYAFLYDKAFKGVFKSYIEDLSSKNLTIIISSSTNLEPSLLEIKRKELKLKEARLAFKSKYQL